MITMLDRLNNLTVEQRRQLSYAFENQFSQYVEIGNGKIVGVNVAALKNIKIEESAGTWVYGEIKKS